MQELALISCTEHRAQCLSYPSICEAQSIDIGVALNLFAEPTADPIIQTSGDPEPITVSESSV